MRAGATTATTGTIDAYPPSRPNLVKENYHVTHPADCNRPAHCLRRQLRPWRQLWLWPRGGGRTALRHFLRDASARRLPRAVRIRRRPLLDANLVLSRPHHRAAAALSG